MLGWTTPGRAGRAQGLERARTSEGMHCRNVSSYERNRAHASWLSACSTSEGTHRQLEWEGCRVQDLAWVTKAGTG